MEVFKAFFTNCVAWAGPAYRPEDGARGTQPRQSELIQSPDLNAWVPALPNDSGHGNPKPAPLHLSRRHGLAVITHRVINANSLGRWKPSTHWAGDGAIPGGFQPGSQPGSQLGSQPSPFAPHQEGSQKGGDLGQSLVPHPFHQSHPNDLWIEIDVGLKGDTAANTPEAPAPEMPIPEALATFIPTTLHIPVRLMKTTGPTIETLVFPTEVVAVAEPIDTLHWVALRLSDEATRGSAVRDEAIGTQSPYHRKAVFEASGAGSIAFGRVANRSDEPWSRLLTRTGQGNGGSRVRIEFSSRGELSLHASIPITTPEGAQEITVYNGRSSLDLLTVPDKPGKRFMRVPMTVELADERP